VSQYPSPYIPPPYSGGVDYYSGGGDPRGPFRRAGILLIVLGSIGFLFGFCLGATLAAVSFEQVMAQSGMSAESLNGMTPEAAKTAMLVIMGLIALLGLVMLLLGVFVCRSSRAAAVGGLIVSGLATALGALWMLSALLAAVTHPLPQMAAGLCMLAIPMVLLILTMIFLVQALRASRNPQLSHQQYMAQMWQMQQQAAQNQAGYGYGYGQPGYGYAPPAPPQVPPPQAAPPALAPAPDVPPTRHPPLPPDSGQDKDRNYP
jgi:hypothetical protein